MYRQPMPSPNGTNYAGLYLPDDWSNRVQLAFDAMPRGLRRGRDQEPDEALSAEDIERVLKMLARNLPAGEHDRVIDMLREIVDGGSLEQFAAEDRRHRRYGRDEPEPFGGRPRPGGELDQAEDRRRARDRHRRHYSMDSMPSSRLRSFAEMFPGVARIGRW
jgi:hypothetical protein